VFLGADEALLDHEPMIVLKHHEYIKVINRRTGVIDVRKGPCEIVLEGDESLLGEISNGINIDDETAVMVRNTLDGSMALHQKKGVFVPSDVEEIEEVVRKIRLEPHESVIVKRKDGSLSVVQGEEEGIAFFLQPYEQLLELCWSTGLQKESRALALTHFDRRPKFMWYEFEVRTKDNVELHLGITFFWQIVDVLKMVTYTDDAPGDICSHARSMIIQSISQSSFEAFLENFNGIIKHSILEVEDHFYGDRGVEIHSVEVRSISCKDESTQRILQEIIQVTTNRINRLQKQDSENEIELNKVKGQIEAEQRRADYLDIRSHNQQEEARIAGACEAVKVKTFFDGLGVDVKTNEKISIFSMLRKKDYIDQLSRGDAKLFFTPQDVDLSIEMKEVV
jgi:regulator of protease activity HflC (stomatin/prohibitin superfamily)